MLAYIPAPWILWVLWIVVSIMVSDSVTHTRQDTHHFSQGKKDLSGHDLKMTTTWVCLKMLCTQKNPMVFMITIPMRNGYFSLGILTQHVQINPYNICPLSRPNWGPIRTGQASMMMSSFSKSSASSSITASVALPAGTSMMAFRGRFLRVQDSSCWSWGNMRKQCEKNKRLKIKCEHYIYIYICVCVCMHINIYIWILYEHMYNKS